MKKRATVILGLIIIFSMDIDARAEPVPSLVCSAQHLRSAEDANIPSKPALKTLIENQAVKGEWLRAERCWQGRTIMYRLVWLKPNGTLEVRLVKANESPQQEQPKPHACIDCRG